MSAPAYTASFRNLELKTWDSDGRYPWTVTDSDSGAQVAAGESTDLMSAMVAAAQAAGSDWGTAKWRDPDEADESE